MNRPLLGLVLLALRARYRRIFRGLRTAQGILLMLVGAAIFAAMILLPLITSHLDPSLSHQPSPAGRSDPLQRFGPAGLLAFAVLSLFSSARNRGVYFSPAEVDFLFPAPFTRRELLGYRLATQTAHTLLSVLLTAAFLQGYLHGYLQGYWQSVAGLFLAFTFLNLVQVCGSLFAGALEERIVARGRRLGWIVFLGLCFLVFASFRSSGGRGAEGIGAWARDFLGSKTLHWAILPLTTFSEMLAARDLSHFLAWGAGALAVDAGLLVLALRLDIDYSEASLETSRRIHERLQQWRRGGRVTAPFRKLRLSLPAPSRAGGAGTLAWRQAQEMLRESPGAVYLFLPLVVVTFVLLSQPAAAESVRGMQPVRTLTALVMVLPLIVSNWFRFDFRGDLDRIELLRTLPVRPWVLCLGQVTVPALAVASLQIVGIAILAILGAEATTEGAILVRFGPYLSLPLNLLVVALENILFLLFPLRIQPVAPGDFMAVGRAMLAMLAKLATLAVVALAGALLGSVGYSLGGETAAIGAVAAFLLLADLAAVVVLGAVFARFDVTRAGIE